MAREDALQPPFKTSSSEDVFLKIFEAAERGESLFVEEQGGEEIGSALQVYVHLFRFSGMLWKKCCRLVFPFLHFKLFIVLFFHRAT